MKSAPKYKIDNNRLTRLVEKAQRGNRKAMEDVVNMVSGYLYYYCLTLLGDDDKASDAVQDILLTMLKKLNTLEDPKAFLGWLKTVTANYCKTKLTREKKNVSIDDGEWELEDCSDQVCPEKAAEAKEVCSLVRDAVGALPVTLRESVMMFYFNQMSVHQIAETLEVNENTIKSRLFSARQNMKKYLEQYGGALLALCPVQPLSLISFSLIKDAESKKGVLIPYATPEGAIKVAAVNTAAAAGGVALKIAAVGAACLVAAGGIGVAAASGTFSTESQKPSVSHQTKREESSALPVNEMRDGPNTINYNTSHTSAPSEAQAPDEDAPSQPATTLPYAEYYTLPMVRPSGEFPETTVPRETVAPTQPVTEAPEKNPDAPEWTKRSDGKLYFYADPDKWTKVTTVYAYIYEHDGVVLMDWGKKKAAMTSEGGSIWSYDLAKNGVQLSSDKQYGVVFTADWNEQAPDLIFDTSCLGDLAYMCGDFTKSVKSDNNTPDGIRWANQSRSSYARPITIDTLGNVSGEAYWAGDSAESLLKGYMSKSSQLKAVAQMTERTPRQCAYYAGEQLGLSHAQVDAIARSAGIDL